MEFKPLVGLSYEYFFTLANTLIIFLILKKILFKPVLKILDEREQSIKNSIEVGEKAKEEGLKFKEEYETKLNTATNEGHQIVENAKQRAEKKYESIVDEARVEAENIKTKAYDNIEKDKQKAFNDIKNEISEMAVMAASKIIEKDLDENKHKDLIDDFIKEVGDVK
ncbi:F0F1 ATP synthase subunit B [Peptostreptococcus equinus]|uniref:ATP synthase subunit b n=1 Tax=Peptostreptococcus equinus TaxID=3003601 RepID=A0ABY7JNX2_9FIRM|nr:F0F1 ATP synthase subunit B [Peptostreptococcus sp. CBA3647]WAW15070.1 F0F1 ATP synthase subunit B [Peptostreptococcus sp. CBA3647]